MQRIFSMTVLALLIFIGVSNIAMAETTPKNAIKYRHAVMEAMAGHSGAFSMIAFGMVDRPEYLQSHADALAAAGAELKDMFPEGSGGEDTHALPEIWSDPKSFAAAVAEAEKSTAELQTAAAGGDRKTINNAFKAVGKSCKGCHEQFREEHDHDD